MLSSHIVANYTEALRDLTGANAGTWSEQHRDMNLRTFVNYLAVHNPLNTETSDLVNVSTGVIASDNVNVDEAMEIGKNIVNNMDGKCLGDVSFKRKDQEKTFAVIKRSVKVDGKEVQISSDQLYQRLLASVMRNGSPLSEVFSFELSAVAPSLFYDNGQMRKNN